MSDTPTTPIQQAADALCFGDDDDRCDACMTAAECARNPAMIGHARIAVAAYLRATGREQEAQTVEDKSDE